MKTDGKMVKGAIKKFQKIRELKSLNDLKNKKILIWGEQGLGDTIQFSKICYRFVKIYKNFDISCKQKTS